MMNERPSIQNIRREARRLDLATSVPPHVLAPLVADVAKRQADDAIVIIDAAERPSLVPGDLSQSLVAIVRRDVLFQALGNSVGPLALQKDGHVPFVVIDRYGTTVVFIEIGPSTNAPGGLA
jgi:hypothetical protein